MCTSPSANFFLPLNLGDGFVFVAVLFDLVGVDYEVVCINPTPVPTASRQVQQNLRTEHISPQIQDSREVHVEGPEQGRSHKENCGGRGDTKQRSREKRIAQKTRNPRLLRIHFHTLRHWEGNDALP